jgi:hypothetical protein
MPGTGDPHLDAILSHIGSGGGAAQNTGPSAANALGGNYVDGGKVPMVFWGSKPVVEQTIQNIIHDIVTGLSTSVPQPPRS